MIGICPCYVDLEGFCFVLCLFVFLFMVVDDDCMGWVVMKLL